MSEPFVPFAPVRQNTGESKSAAFQPKATAAPPTASPAFQTVSAPSSLPAASLGHKDHAKGSSPQVTLQRDGDRITSIQIRCSCGEVIELKCIY